MAGKRTELPDTAGFMDERIQKLCELAARYPFRWWRRELVMEMCDFGEDTMAMLVRAGAPVAGRKLNPHVVTKWISENVEQLEKTRPEK